MHSLVYVGFGKRVFWKRGLFRKIHFLEILENLEILDNPQTVENKGESDPFLETLENLEIYQGGKRNPNPNFLVRIFSSGVGVFHANGWGPKSSIRPSKPGKSNFLGGISRDFAGISRGRPKSLRKKGLGSIFGP